MFEAFEEYLIECWWIFSYDMELLAARNLIVFDYVVILFFKTFPQDNFHKYAK